MYKIVCKMVQVWAGASSLESSVGGPQQTWTHYMQ